MRINWFDSNLGESVMDWPCLMLLKTICMKTKLPEDIATKLADKPIIPYINKRTGPYIRVCVCPRLASSIFVILTVLFVRARPILVTLMRKTADSRSHLCARPIFVTYAKQPISVQMRVLSACWARSACWAWSTCRARSASFGLIFVTLYFC